MKNNCNLTLSDRFTYELRTKEYCDETFGEDYLEDYGINLPEALLERYRVCMVEHREIQTILRKIYEEK